MPSKLHLLDSCQSAAANGEGGALAPRSQHTIAVAGGAHPCLRAAAPHRACVRELVAPLTSLDLWHELRYGSCGGPQRARMECTRMWGEYATTTVTANAKDGDISCPPL
jgi:hypothetical protein